MTMYHPRFTDETIKKLRQLQKDAEKALNGIRQVTEKAIYDAYKRIDDQVKNDLIK